MLWGGGTGEEEMAAVVVVETLASRKMGWGDWGNAAGPHVL